ncbi:MAG: dockerin type I domain-containing protein [Bacteroidales bacterium]
MKSVFRPNSMFFLLISFVLVYLSMANPGQFEDFIIEDEIWTLRENNGRSIWTSDMLSDRFNIHPDGGGDSYWTARSPEMHKQAGWTIERVHSGKFFNYMGDRSLALDADGNPHIAYGGKHLYYALYDGTEWHIDTVDDSWDVGYCTSLAFDSGGYPHISYYDRDPNGNLKYAYRNEAGWHIQTVDNSDNSLGLYTSLAIDADDHVHISYSDITDGNLKYTHWDGTEWQIETIDSEGFVGEFTSLALDEGGAPHISYFDYTNGHLKYARLQAGQWQLQTVDDNEYVGLYTSIALDPGGHAHISYLDYLQGNLKYATWNGSQWEITTVDNSEFAGVFSSIALDANAHPHIAYYEDDGKNLKYAHYTGSEWEVERLTEDGSWPGGPTDSEGYYTSIALDAMGQPHISHSGQGALLGSRFGLRYTYYDGSEWQRDKVDYELIFSHTSLAVDNTNNPHIAYIKSDRNMGYTRWDGSQWHYENLRPSGNIVRHASGSGSFLALDADQRPHIIIQEMKNHLWPNMPSYPAFIYTWYDGSIWNENVLYSSSFNYQRNIESSSISIDDLDRPNICFYGYLTNMAVFPPSTSYFFKYMFRENNEWFSSDIETSSGMGKDHSFVIDSDGLPQVSYTSYSYLRYATLVEGGWDKQIILEDLGSYNSIKTDANDFPHISFLGYDPQQDNTALKYANWDGSEWQIGIVDNIGDVGKYTSLDFDSNDYPHISYYDETNGNLKYAYWDGSQWQIETIDSYRNVGLYTSLALDANDNPYISYYDASFGDLKYATKAATPTEYTLTFVVENAYGDPVADAVVTLDGTEYPPGQYDFPGMEPGTYHYSVSRNCYQTFEGQVAITNTNKVVAVILDNNPGDTNDDGVVNVSDVIVITNFYMGQISQPFCFVNADVNADGIINVQDVIGAVNIFMGPRSATSVNTDQQEVFKQ